MSCIFHPLLIYLLLEMSSKNKYRLRLIWLLDRWDLVPIIAEFILSFYRFLYFFYFLIPLQENTSYKRAGLTQLKCSGMLVAQCARVYTLPKIGLETKANLYKRPNWCSKSVNKIHSCQLGATSLLVKWIDLLLSLRNKTWVNLHIASFCIYYIKLE